MNNIEQFIEKLCIHANTQINSVGKIEIDFSEYGFTKEELIKCKPILDLCILNSKSFFWFGYKEALGTILRKLKEEH